MLLARGRLSAAASAPCCYYLLGFTAVYRLRQSVRQALLTAVLNTCSNYTQQKKKKEVVLTLVLMDVAVCYSVLFDLYSVRIVHISVNCCV